MHYFLVPSFFSAIVLGSVISIMHSNDADWREHLLIWGGFGASAVLAVFAYAYTNKDLIERYMKNPGETKLISEILFGKKKKQE